MAGVDMNHLSMHSPEEDFLEPIAAQVMTNQLHRNQQRPWMFYPVNQELYATGSTHLR
jgi:hypothetical protein